MSLLLSILFLISSFSSEVRSQQPYVTVAQGRLFGETVDFVDHDVTSILTKVDVFKGIPFAEPPIRFSNPVEKSPWEGDWNATYYRPACIQGPDGFKFWFKPNMDEDCLYLNIFVPHPKPQDAPVMVFMHGGGYALGSAIEEGYSGVPLTAIGDVIIVTTNYRLGVFGFFSTGDPASPGNYGMLDQVEALKWVHRNIEEFGGDKNRVTIFGESAGARASHLHMFSKLSMPYFNQAIMQSGWAIARNDSEGERNDALYVGSLFGCDTADTYRMVECLRGIEAMELLNNSPYPIIPNVDGYFLENSPEDLIMKGAFKHCPILIGFNEDEGTLTASLNLPGSETAKEPPHLQREHFQEMVRSVLEGTGEYVSSLIEDSVEQEYVDWSQADNESADYLDTFVRFRTDQRYSCGATYVSKVHAKFGIPVYLYKMTQIPSKDPSRKNLSEPINDAKWEWPKYDLPDQKYKELGPGLPIGRAPRSDECNFWTSFLPDLRIFMTSMDDVEREWREQFVNWKDDLENWREIFKVSSDDTC